MRRSGPPQRRTPLKPGKSMPRGGKILRRERMKPMSNKFRAVISDHAEIREAVFDRDGYRCQLAHVAWHHCFGHLTPHHKLNASQGGGYTLENLVTLCSFGNDWLEDHPDEGRRLGLVIRRADVEGEPS